MKKSMSLLALLLLASFAPGQSDGFIREGEGKSRKAKDAMEGKAPPQLQVGPWLNTKVAQTLPALKGKVVLLDFWGTW